MATTEIARREAAERLGVTEGRIRQLERQGDLHAVRRPDGRYALDRDEVDRLALARLERRPRPVRDEGQLAALAFALFDEGTDLRIAVRTLRVPPSTVDRLYLDWRSLDLEKRAVHQHAERLRLAEERRQTEKHRRREKSLARMERMVARTHAATADAGRSTSATAPTRPAPSPSTASDDEVTPEHSKLAERIAEVMALVGGGK
jgi:hypothetical protein